MNSTESESTKRGKNFFIATTELYLSAVIGSKRTPNEPL